MSDIFGGKFDLPFGIPKQKPLPDFLTGKPATEKSKKTESDDSGIVHINSQCKIVVYNWKIERESQEYSIERSAKDLSQTTQIDVSSRLVYASFTKSLGNASGHFSFTLANNTGDASLTDWRDIIKPGSWCVIYMSQNGDLDISTDIYTVKSTDPKKVRCIGYIERSSIKSELTEQGAFDSAFEFSGRDFGIIFEETTIWHNTFKVEKALIDSLKGGKLNVVGNSTIDEVLKEVHDLIWAPDKLFKDQKSEEGLTSQARQWLLPVAMLNDLRISFDGDSYYGNIKDNFEAKATVANIPVVQPADFLSGNAWEKLKSLSVPPFHELFCETKDDGKLSLKFRPIPWALEKKDYPNVGSVVDTFISLNPRVPLSSLDVITFDLGEDNHNRKNHFLVTIGNSLFNAWDSVTLLKGSRFPLQDANSVKRHGFRPMHTDCSSFSQMKQLVNNEDSSSKDGASSKAILVEWCEALYDLWKNAVYFESGTVSMIGRNDIKIGKAIEFDGSIPYESGKIFYLEEYTDEVMMVGPGSWLWTQHISLTHGAEIEDLVNKTGFSIRGTPYKQNGEFNE